MELINTNRLRVSLRLFRRGYGERLRDVSYGAYRSSDHDKPRAERNYYAHGLGMVVRLKWRPDGKSTALSEGG